MRFPLVLARNVDARLNPAAPFEPVALAWSLASSNFQRYLAADVTLHAYDWQSGPGYPLFLEPMAEYPRMNVLGSNFPSPYNDDQWVARRIFRNPRGIFSFDGYYRSMTAAYGPFAAPPTSAHPCNIGLTIAVNTPDDTHHTLTVAYYDPLDSMDPLFTLVRDGRAPGVLELPGLVLPIDAAITDPTWASAYVTLALDLA